MGEKGKPVHRRRLYSIGANINEKTCIASEGRRKILGGLARMKGHIVLLGRIYEKIHAKMSNGEMNDHTLKDTTIMTARKQLASANDNMIFATITNTKNPDGKSGE